MSFKDRRKTQQVEEPKKETPKKVVVLKKVEPKNEPKKEEKKISETKKEEKQVVEASKTVSTSPAATVSLPNIIEKKYDKVGLAGDNEEIRNFKAKLKMQGKKVGTVLMEFIKEWNSKN